MNKRFLVVKHTLEKKRNLHPSLTQTVRNVLPVDSAMEIFDRLTTFGATLLLRKTLFSFRVLADTAVRLSPLLAQVTIHAGKGGMVYFAENANTIIL